MTRIVNTVTGQLPCDELGITLMHEHLCTGPEGIMLDSRFEFDAQERMDLIVSRLSAAKAHGIATVVDATPIDLNRDAGLIREAAEATDMNIVCATGVYVETHGVPSYFRHMSAEELSQLYVHEITEGIGRTGVHAGVIKVATSEHGIGDLNRKLLEAAADAQAKTLVPIITHTSGGYGLGQARALVESGAVPEQVMIGHIDHKYASFSYYERILRTGVNLGFDRCGLAIFLPHHVRAALVAAFVSMGLQSRLFLSMDSSCSHLGPLSPLERDAPTPLVYLVTEFADLLAQYGVTRPVLDQILTDNPARLFAGAS